MDRRSFVLAAAALAVGCTPKAEPVATAMTESAPLGIQLYTVRDLMAEDVAATLDFVAASGYREVEFAGYYDHTPEQMRSLLEAAGLRAPSAHIGYGNFLEDTSKVIDHAAAMGHKYIVVPYLDETQRTLDDYRRHCENFNRWGEACADAGMQFAYHNHDFEFQLTEDALPYDLLLAETDPKLVAMELDLAWARKGNADMLAYFTAWPGRFVAFHIKDMNAEGNEADIGTGDVDFETIFRHAKAAGVKHGFVERDHPADVHYSVKHNFDAIAPLWNTYMNSAA